MVEVVMHKRETTVKHVVCHFKTGCLYKEN